VRRAAALVLIAASVWLIYHTCSVAFGADFHGQLNRIAARSLEGRVLFPVLGGLFGAVGGVIVLLGGPGGASIAMLGGVVAAGFSFYTDQPLHVTAMRVWENDALIGLTILFLAGVASILARD
jgi:hypothetical protein